MPDQLSPEEKTLLLHIARTAIEKAVRGQREAPVDISILSPLLQEPGCSFVTLTRHGNLRGCIGSLEPALPLAEDVRQHAIAAALQDYRFPPVVPDEIPVLEIEISRLTRPQPLVYERPDDLPRLLHPGQDGVVLHDRYQRATFLPQVWEKLPSPEEFLGHLCQKMGAPASLWRSKKLQVEIYHVEEFHE